MTHAHRIQTTTIGSTREGATVHQYRLTNEQGLVVRAMDYGGIIISLLVPDRHGESGDVLVGFDRLEDYLGEHPYFGALIGRVGNRIGNARFELDGQVYSLAANNGPHHLHGGLRGFDRQLWSGAPFEQDDRAGVVLTYESAHGEEGYPGNLDVDVTYVLTDQNTLSVAYRATTDTPTHFNPTQHMYFNLAGEGSILNHDVQIHADAFTEIDEELITTGSVLDVDQTPFDFRNLTRIGDRIDAGHPQLRAGRGFDHNFVVRRTESNGDTLVHAAHVEESTSGRSLDVYTTEPGIQFYTGNFLDGTLRGKGGTPIRHRTGLCLETQHFPDTPNRPEFPTTRLEPGQVFRSRTEFRFSIAS